MLGNSFTLGAGVSYTVEVTFSPTSIGDHAATLDFVTDDVDEDDQAVSVALAGTAEEDPAGPPVAPEDVDAAAASDRQINLTWEDTAAIETGYEVYEATAADGAYELIATLDADSTGYSRTGLSKGTTRYYRVVAINGNGSADPVQVSATTSTDTAGKTIGNARDLGKLVGRRTISETVGTGDPKDFYRIKMSRNGTLRIRMNGMIDDADVVLVKLNADGRTVTKLVKSEGFGTSAEFAQANLSAGAYYVCVYPGDSGVNTPYTLSLEADYAGRAIKYALNLGTITRTTYASDFIGADDTADFYKFTISARRNVALTLGALSADADLELYSPSGTRIKVSENEGTAAENISRSLPAGSWYVKVLRYSGDTNYKLKVAFS